MFRITSSRARSPWVQYSVAVVLVGIALLLVVGLREQLHPHAYAIFLFVVAATAFLSGFGPALLATFLALAAMNYADYLMHAAQFDVTDFVQLAVFTTMAMTISFLTAARERAERSLERANAELRELDRAKDRLIASVSHELKSPVTAILGWAEIMRRDSDPELRGSALEAIDQSARTQARLVEDLLDVSRLILGKLRLQVAPTSLRSIVQAAAEMIRPAAEAKGIAVTVDIPSNPCIVDGDALRLQQICSNLLSNSIKFTPGGGTIEIRLRCDEQNAEICVTDTGQGIPADLLPHVFDLLRQGSGATAKGGLGLGLNIVRQLTEMHRGSVEAQSAGVGKGSRFIVRIPLVAEIG